MTCECWGRRIPMDDWREELARRFAPLAPATPPEVLSQRELDAQRERFYRTVAVPALRELKTELEQYGRVVEVRTDERSHAEMTVRYAGCEELYYAVKVRLEAP